MRNAERACEIEVTKRKTMESILFRALVVLDAEYSWQVRKSYLQEVESSPSTFEKPRTLSNLSGGKSSHHVLMDT